MPPKKIANANANTEAAARSLPALTQNEYSFIGSMLRHMNSRPDIDWDGVAQDCGLKDAKCTKERYRQMSVKHGWNNTAKKPSDSQVIPTKRVAKPRAPRKKAKKESESELAMNEAKVGEISSTEEQDKGDDSDVV